MSPYDSFPLFIQVTLAVIVLLFLALAVAYISILGVRAKSSRDNKRRTKYQAKFREVLIDEIFTKENLKVNNLGVVADKLQAIHGDRQSRKRILIEDIKHFRTQFAGITNEALQKLYLELNLQSQALKGLSSFSKHKVILSIKELMQMGIVEPGFQSDKFLNNKNHYIRQITRLYVIELEEGGIEKVFNNLNKPISGIESLELFESITSLGTATMPDFSRWMGLDRPLGLVSLCLKLSVYFQQFASAPSIEKLLSSENEVLRNEAINAIGKLLQTGSELSLVNRYDLENEVGKTEIIKALGRISSGSQLNFLKYIFDNEPNVLLKKHAAKSVVNHSAIGRVFLTNMYKKASLENLHVLNHVLNNNIKY
ncbi:HEAT repeat domain-containing protein [Chryseobacterium sp. A301]